MTKKYSLLQAMHIPDDIKGIVEEEKNEEMLERGKELYHLGLCFEWGIGVGKNLVEAARYYRLAAERGYASGQYHFGDCLSFGKGVPKDEKTAAQYFRFAADQGHQDASIAYICCLAIGKGIERNEKEAERRLSLAKLAPKQEDNALSSLEQKINEKRIQEVREKIESLLESAGRKPYFFQPVITENSSSNSSSSSSSTSSLPGSSFKS